MRLEGVDTGALVAARGKNYVFQKRKSPGRLTNSRERDAGWRQRGKAKTGNRGGSDER
jgi:hypothetical protein